MTGNHGASFDEPVVLPTNISYFTLMADQGAITPDILSHEYEGSGTEDDPYMVTWILNDPRNPLHFSLKKRLSSWELPHLQP